MNRIYYNHNSDLGIDSKGQYLYYTCYRISELVHTRMHTDTKMERERKIYLLKIPLEFSEIFTSNVSALSQWAKG